MKRVLIALLVCFSGIAAVAQTADGTVWRVLRADEKLFYVIGYREGNCTGAAQTLADFQPNDTQGKGIAGCVFPGGITNAKIVAYVDRFYANPRNRPITTSIALMCVKSELEGTPLTDVMLESFRKHKPTKARP